MRRAIVAMVGAFAVVGMTVADEKASPRMYQHRLTPLVKPGPLLEDHPQYVEPIRCERRFEAPTLVDDAGADLEVRAWRFSYNVRGIVEMPNRLKARHTAVIVVHPWGIDDGQGWKTPEPAGACDFCTPAKNALAGRHTREIINPFLKSLRGQVGGVVLSLIGGADPIRTRLYRSLERTPTAEERQAAAAELERTLRSFKYEAGPLPERLALSAERPVADYFRQVPGLDAGPRYNGPGFWKLPVPVTRDIDVHPEDVVVYDEQGYPALRDFLRKQGIRHVLMTGYATDMCYARTTAGFKNLEKDFNVFLVGDATLATFPANDTPAPATNAAIAFASIDHLVTQVSWIRQMPRKEKR